MPCMQAVLRTWSVHNSGRWLEPPRPEVLKLTTREKAEPGHQTPSDVEVSDAWILNELGICRNKVLRKEELCRDPGLKPHWKCIREDHASMRLGPMPSHGILGLRKPRREPVEAHVPVDVIRAERGAGLDVSLRQVESALDQEHGQLKPLGDKEPHSP